MKQLTNEFGTGILHNIDEIKKPVYITCAACMSVWSDALSWANHNKSSVTTDLSEAKSIVVLGCQATDLAILNDLSVLSQHMTKQGAKYYIGGCLGKRFDIPLVVSRVDNFRVDYQPINNKNLVQYVDPFWVTDFKDKLTPTSPGRLFREMYPLRIGVGCKQKCEYCTIRETRGMVYHLESKFLVEEFVHHNDVVLIADSPSVNQLKEWCDIALKHNKPISLRNVHPSVAVKLTNDILILSKQNLLPIFHCPVQSLSTDILQAMNRSVKDTEIFIETIVPELHKNTFTATNIIIDYKSLKDNTIDYIKTLFDYVSWNPYWNGVWNTENAVERWKKYLT